MLFFFCDRVKTSIPGAVLEEESLFSSLLAQEDLTAVMFPDSVYQPVFADEFFPSPEQVQVCGGHHQCTYDYAQTGSKEIGLMTKTIETSNAKNAALLGTKVFQHIQRLSS